MVLCLSKAQRERERERERERMPQNRGLEENGNVESEEGSNTAKDMQRRVPALGSVVSEIMRLLAEPGSKEPELERLIGGVINKEVELALAKQMHLCNKKWDIGNEIHPSESRSLQLQFLNKLSLPVLTGTKIGGEEYTSIKVALVDGLTGQVVNSGPEASAKVEIVAIEKGFDGYEGDNRTLEEFNGNSIRERDGKSPLLTGDVYFHLKEGIGSIGGVYFTHTKRWMTKREFRLGARIVDGSQGVRVREAKTEPFIVEDRRGKLYQKHHPPSLSDAVWRLEKIGKDGAFHKRLSKENINTVKDFVTLLNINPQRLKDILGTTMSAKMWEAIMDHARTCTLDQRLYFYGSPGSLQKSGVVFNEVGEVRGIISECQYAAASIDKLSETKKADTLKLVIAAFKHWEDVVLIDDEASLFNGSLCLPNVLYPSNSVITESSDGSDIRRNDNLQLGASSHDIVPTIFSIWDVNGLGDYDLQSIDDIDYRYEQPLSFTSPVNSSLICDTDSMIQAFIEDEHLQFSDNHCSLQSRPTGLESQGDQQNAVNDTLLARSAAVTMNKAQRRSSSKKNAQRRWRTLFSIMRWFSVKRNVARKTPFEEMHKDAFPGGINPSIYPIGAVNSFNDHCSVQPQNSDLGSQANMHSAVNDILLARSAVVAMNKSQKRYISKRDKAQRRWRMLFSIMRWFSVERKVAGKTRVREMPKNLNTSSRDIMPSIYSMGGMNGYNDDGLQSTGYMDRTYEQPLSFPGYITKSPFCDEGSMTRAFCEYEHLQPLDTSCSIQSQNSDLEPPGNLQSAVNDILLARSAVVAMNKAQRRYLSKREEAQRRWRMLFSIMRWLSVKRNVARKTCVREMPKKLSASSRNIVPSIYSLGGMNGFNDDGLQSASDMDHRYEQPLSFPGYITKSPFCEDEHLQLLDTHCSIQSQNSDLEPLGNLPGAVNDTLLGHSAAVGMTKTHRRYVLKGNKAQRRWRMLFSVARWFSVRRNVARKSSIEEIPFKLSASSQDIMSSVCYMGNMNSLDNDGLQSTHNTKSIHKESMPGQVSNSLICDTECMTQGFCEDENLKVFYTHCSLQPQNSNLESQASLHNAVNDILLARSTAVAMNKAQKRYLLKRNKAQRRWRMLFSVVRWFSVRRNVARKGHVIDLQRYC